MIEKTIKEWVAKLLSGEKVEFIAEANNGNYISHYLHELELGQRRYGNYLILLQNKVTKKVYHNFWSHELSNIASHFEGLRKIDDASKKVYCEASSVEDLRAFVKFITKIEGKVIINYDKSVVFETKLQDAYKCANWLSESERSKFVVDVDIAEYSFYTTD